MRRPQSVWSLWTVLCAIGLLVLLALPAAAQPDAMIATPGAAVLLGDDLYNVAAGQTATYTTPITVPAAYRMRVQNDGVAAASFQLTATATDNTGWTLGITNDAGAPVTLPATLAALGAGAYADYTVTLTPTPLAAGPCTVTLTVTDTVEETKSDTVVCVTTPGAVASDSAVTVFEDRPAAGQCQAMGAAGQALTYTVVTPPAHGVLALDAAQGAFTYTPTADASDVDSFTFTVSDGLSTSAPATVTFMFTLDDTPATARVLTPAQTVTQAIGVENDVDWVTFTLTSPSSVILTTTGGTPLDDLELWLYGPNSSTQSAPAPNYSDDDNGMAGRIIHPSTNPLAPGVYYAKITSFLSATVVPSYTVRLVVIPLAVAAAPTISPASGSYADRVSVTLTSATAGATLHYTTDGSMPTASSPVYGSPLTLTSAATVRACAMKIGLADSAVTTTTYTLCASTPTAMPAPGIKSNPTTVTLRSATNGAVLYYTTDGSTPTAASTRYTTGIPLTTSTTFKVIALKDGLEPSGVFTAAYTLRAAAPTANPVSGTYQTSVSVALSSVTTGAPIYYTTDGSLPTSESLVYTKPLLFTQTTTLRARVIPATGLEPSGAITALYTVQTATPVIRPTVAQAFTTLQVTMTCATPGAAIAYTTDGSDPATAGTVYAGPISLTRSATVRAVATKDGQAVSAEATQTYTLKVATPTLTPTPGTFSSFPIVTMNCVTPGVTYHYTIDGTLPTLDSPLLSGGLPLTRTTTVRVLAAKDGLVASDVRSGKYVIRAAAPIVSPTPGVFITSRVVTLRCISPDAVIQYTTDGSVPTATSPVYTSALTLTSTTLLRARATAPGMLPSTLVSALFTCKVATPTFTPTPGLYSAPLAVTLKCATPDAQLFYTTDGSTPTAASTPYTGEIPVAATTTLRAVAIRDGAVASNLATGIYTLKALTPRATPGTGVYNNPVTVTLSCSTPDVQLHYTTDGTTPTAASTLYTDPFVIAKSTTLKVVAAKAGMSTSSVLTSVYTLQVAAPTMTPKPGTYATPVEVTLASATTDAQLYYTIDGTEPTKASTPYTGPVPVNTTMTLRARAYKEGMSDSVVTVGAYTLQANKPTATPGAGTFYTPTSVTLSSTTPTDVLRYTTDGSEPTGTSPIYTAPIPIVGPVMTLKARAFADGVTPSAVLTASYTLKVRTPSITPQTITAVNPVTVTLSCQTPDAELYYTTDGTTPTASSQRYTDPFVVVTTTTLKVIGVKAGWQDSAVTSATYTIKGATPVLSPAGGTYNNPVAVTLTSATVGAEIRYTTDGTDPTASSPLAAAPVSITQTGTVLKAAVFSNGERTSAIASGTYTLVVAKPVFSPTPGTVSGSVTVRITCATADAQIWYTTDGSDPVTAGVRYTDPIAVSATTTLRVVATHAGMNQSVESTATYTVE